MKKIFILFAAVLLVAGMSFAQTSRTFNLQITVQKYVELNPSFPTLLNYGTIIPPDNGGATILNGDERPDGVPDWTEFAYANCGVTITFAGNNPAGDGVPCFARMEDGSGRYDRLNTKLHFQLVTWDPSFPVTPIYNNTHIFNAFVSTIPGTWWNPTATIPVPHNGEIYLNTRAGVALPAVTPDYGKRNTWSDSADAGVYTATVTITIAAI